MGGIPIYREKKKREGVSERGKEGGIPRYIEKTDIEREVSVCERERERERERDVSMRE